MKMPDELDFSCVDPVSGRLTPFAPPQSRDSEHRHYYHSRVVKALKAENEALKAELAQRQWQDISTAPKDGTIIDIWVSYPDGGERYENAYFDKDENAFCAVIPEFGKREIFTATPPTHWMPLPDAPEVKE